MASSATEWILRHLRARICCRFLSVNVWLNFVPSVDRGPDSWVAFAHSSIDLSNHLFNVLWVWYHTHSPVTWVGEQLPLADADASVLRVVHEGTTLPALKCAKCLSNFLSFIPFNHLLIWLCTCTSGCVEQGRNTWSPVLFGSLTSFKLFVCWLWWWSNSSCVLVEGVDGVVQEL